jgi:hypothetical protein
MRFFLSCMIQASVDEYSLLGSQSQLTQLSSYEPISNFQFIKEEN